MNITSKQLVRCSNGPIRVSIGSSTDTGDAKMDLLRDHGYVRNAYNNSTGLSIYFFDVNEDNDFDGFLRIIGDGESHCLVHFEEHEHYTHAELLV